MLAAAPQIASKLNRLVRDSAHLEDIVELIQYDPGLTARILRVCNSAAYRGRTDITSLHAATSLLGAETLSRIVWQVSLGSGLSGPLSVYGFGAGDLWRHSMTSAIAAEELWKISVFEEDIGTAFTAGLLHDVGKILTNVAVGDQGALFRKYIEMDNMAIYEAETALLGFNHADVSGRLLAKWEQSETLISAATHHHQPEKAENRRFATLICVASQCAHRQEQALNRLSDGWEMAKERLDILQIGKSGLEKAMEAVQRRAAEVEVLVAIM